MVKSQDTWRYCKKCNGLFYAGQYGENPGSGLCPAGGGHDGSDSFNYVMYYNP